MCEIEKILKFAELYCESATSRNEYMRNYMANKYHQTRNKILERLGGKCKMCGTKEGPFHLDHIDAKKKTMRAADLHSVNEGKFEEEVKGLQILCPKCHRAKTIDSADFAPNPSTHGTYWHYRKYKCRCPECVNAYREKQREWKKKKED